MTNERPADLIPTFAHDLRQSLRSILMQAQRIQRQADGVSEETLLKVEEIVAAAKRQDQLIAAMLEYEQAGDEELASTEKPLPLKLAIQTACMKLEVYRAQCGGTVAFDTAATPPAQAPARLAKVMEKVLHNALKFRKRETPPIVRIETSLRGDEILVRVVDTGIGIDAQHRESVFTPFRRLNPASEYPGCGLSLATCRRLLAGIGGHIAIEDRAGETVFQMRVPAARPA